MKAITLLLAAVTTVIGLISASPISAAETAAPDSAGMAQMEWAYDSWTVPWVQVKGAAPALAPASHATLMVLALPGCAYLYQGEELGLLEVAELLDLEHGALNLHPSLLPRHRGATPIPAAILAGDHETGVSLMQMDPGLDTGPLVAVEHVSLAGDETSPALEARLAIVAAGLLARTLDPWLAGEIEPEPQSAAGATLTRPLRRVDGILDPDLPAELLERQVRAHLPWPGSYVEIDGDRLVVLAASVTASDPDDDPGLFVPDHQGLALATRAGRLLLDEVQPAGGRPMSGEAYLRGRPSVLGSAVRRSSDDATSRPGSLTESPTGDRSAEPA
jgi:methionyl-tRNA formyltransferase